MTTGDLWAATAIGLGVWEGASVLDARVPRVSHAVWAAERRWPRPARVAVLLWLVALWLHWARVPTP